MHAILARLADAVRAYRRTGRHRPGTVQPVAADWRPPTFAERLAALADTAQIQAVTA